MNCATSFTSKFVNYKEIQSIKENYENYSKKFVLLLNTIEKKTQLKKIGDFLTVALRIRYSGFTGYQVLKLYNTFREINITIELVELLLKRIDRDFDRIDSAVLIALSTHRTATYYSIEKYYPARLEKLYNLINIEVNPSSLIAISERIIYDDIYYIIEEFCDKTYADNNNLLKMILRNLQTIRNIGNVEQEYILSLFTKNIFGEDKEIIDEIIAVLKNLSFTDKDANIKLISLIYFGCFAGYDKQELCKSILGMNTENVEQLIKNIFLKRIKLPFNDKDLVIFNIINYQYLFNDKEDQDKCCHI